MQAAECITSTKVLKSTLSKKKKINFRKTLFFHSKYYPKDLISKTIEINYNDISSENFQDEINIEYLIIIYS